MNRAPAEAQQIRTEREEQSPVRVSYARSISGIRVALTILATIASLWAVQWGSVFLIPCTVAVCMTFWLMPLVDRLQRMRIPRSLGAALVLFALMGAIGFTGYALRDDAREFTASLPLATHHAREILDEAARDPNGWIYHARSVWSDRVSGNERAGGKARPAPVIENPADLQEVVVKGSTTAMAVLATAGVILFSMYLMLAAGDLFKRKLMVVVSSQVDGGNLTRKRATIEILNEIGLQLQRYLGVLAVTNIAIGLLTWTAFAALGVKNAAVWGVAAAILHIIPYGGPAVVAIASFLVSSWQFDSFSRGFLVASVSMLIFILIGMLVTTWLAGRASKMNSVAVFTGLIFWGWLWGIPGLLLGTPMMMALKVVADRIECLNWLGTFMGEAPKRERRQPVNDDQAEQPSEAANGSLAGAPALTEGAAVGEPALSTAASDPTLVAAEVSAEATIIAADKSSSQDAGERFEHAQHGKSFDAPPFPA